LQRIGLRALLACATAAAVYTVAGAQSTQSGFTLQPGVTAPPLGYQPASSNDAMLLDSALGAARSGDIERARSIQAGMSDSVGRKLVQWAIIDVAPNRVSFFELDQARRDLWGWPRQARRQAAAERGLETSGLPPAQVVAWFKGEQPKTGEGAMALASAYQATGRQQEARELVRRFWRDEMFESDVQSRFLARFGAMLTQDDHVARTDMLLYGPQGPAAQAMIPLLPYDKQAAARARMVLRSNANNANDVVSALPPGEATSPGVAFERAKYLRQRNLDSLALGLVGNFPKRVANTEIADDIWRERRLLVNAALKSGNLQAAYQASAHSGLPPGVDLAEAEFYAGWLALRLKRPMDADRHFARIAEAGTSPITQGRALYWRGRANEAMGDPIEAQRFYSQAARYDTTFYGQLAAEKAGQKTLTLGRDPQPTAADRSRFEGRELVRAIRLLTSAGETDLARVFITTVDDSLPNAEEYALLVDMVRGNGDQFGSMQVVRAAAQKGFVLPERGYPITGASSIVAPERALVFGIVRQESSFDPKVKSGAGARGMMQLMPATASMMARRNGVDYSPYMLDDASYNVRLGSFYLQSLVDQFSGSYAMAAAGYNAGPGRPLQWVSYCGDPRGGRTDAIDFIECIPFSETRNYVMRVMEGMQVYRARLNGGTAPITLSADLKRGSYAYGGQSTPYVAQRSETLIPGPVSNR
jgi:peptidoglycan lytic transglycosylase